MASKTKPTPAPDAWEEDDVEDTEVIVTGDVAALGDPSALGDLLLEMTCGAVKASMLLAEADEGEFKTVRLRLRALKAAVEGLPNTATKREPMGFRPTKKKRKR